MKESNRASDLVRALALLCLSGLLVAGCNGTGGTDATSEELLETSAKVYLDEADYEAVAEFVSECRGNKLCVTVCHRPPGNPTNSKTMQLPLAATRAHLHHGGPNTEKDYLGPCRASESGGGDNEGDTGGDPGGGSGEEEPTPDEDENENPEIPNWCLIFYQQDQNCDGFIDETGESYF